MITLHQQAEINLRNIDRLDRWRARYIAMFNFCPDGTKESIRKHQRVCCIDDWRRVTAGIFDGKYI